MNIVRLLIDIESVDKGSSIKNAGGGVDRNNFSDGQLTPSKNYLDDSSHFRNLQMEIWGNLDLWTQIVGSLFPD